MTSPSGNPAPLNESRLRHLAARLHTLGPLRLFELLRKLAAGPDLVERLQRYAELDPATVAAIGACVQIATLIWVQP